ncbi:M20/M25/M40 family metallo-hydrolase [Pseudothermotoga thermarum]|uniref:Peptidase dimerization domain protein n=1 Tax=Pseudothermotoga thermarum DSM 5069 TaxID=688269 RepID=F7YTV6_9THEM|nr:M20/M25/M40 family metallo-hydrolase [Pseudothermotoga thermarum]AEH51403.1 peptidase dimerization domain protein [Pseudothermotoga thermarum DSM 5069]
MEKRLIELYERLVNTDTGFDIDYSTKLARTSFVVDELRKLGFSAHQEEAAHVAILGEPPYITLIGHLDTVFKEGESSKRPFKVVDSIAYGPGVADMKGGIIVLLKVAEEAVKSGVKNLCIIMNVDEELGSKASRKTFYAYAEKSLCCLSFEPGGENGSLILTRKGIVPTNLYVKGIKGHAARLHEGANAILEAARKIDQIYSLNGKFGSVTLNPTLINGGEKSNITPDSCKVYFDIRYLERNDFEKCKLALEKICSETTVPGTSCQIEFEESRPSMTLHPKMKEAVEKVLNKLGINVEFEHSSGGADSAFFSQANVPTLDGLGICGGKFHSEQEFALLDTFEPRVKIALELIRYFSEVKE